MGDLDFYQSATPSVIVNDLTGDRLKPEADGSLPNDLTKVGGTAITLGQKAMAASLPMVISSNQSAIPVTPISSIGTRVMLTGTLVTTATTADQVVLTYTVTSGKTLFLQYLTLSGYVTTAFTTGQAVGTISLESPAGTKLITHNFVAQTVGAINKVEQAFNGIPIPAGTVIRVVTTPSAVASRTWVANFGGFEL
jgi:hypothetical protein